MRGLRTPVILALIGGHGQRSDHRSIRTFDIGVIVRVIWAARNGICYHVLRVVTMGTQSICSRIVCLSRTLSSHTCVYRLLTKEGMRIFLFKSLDEGKARYGRSLSPFRNRAFPCPSRDPRCAACGWVGNKGIACERQDNRYYSTLVTIYLVSDEYVADHKQYP